MLAADAGAVRYRGQPANGQRADRVLSGGHRSLPLLLRRLQSRVKRVLDRSIAVSLPFFTYRGGRVHHPLRYKNHPKLKVFFYGAVTDFERDTARQLAEANRVNMGFSSVQVSFAESLGRLAEVIKE